MTLISPDAPTVRIDYDDDKHRYKVNGQDVPSVTTILDATLPKPALTWWGFRVGMGAAVELTRNGHLSYADLIGGHDDLDLILSGDPSPAFAHDNGKGKQKTLIEMLACREKLDPNHVRDRAADRGTGVHEALVLLAAGGLPKVSEFPDNQRPFVQALLSWFLQQEPQFEPGGTEQLVAYAPDDEAEHGWYAGRFDLLTRDPDGTLVLNDLKTGKEVRPDSHFRQLMGYKIAHEWMGKEPIGAMRIILCRADGEYLVKQAKVSKRSWFACLDGYYANEEFKDLNRVRAKRRPK